MPQMRTGIVVKNTEPMNHIVLPSNPTDAEAYIAAFDGKCTLPDPDDEMRVQFVTISGCFVVEVTGMDPMPGVGTGWTYVGGEWVAPAEPDDE
jgi:hypothetical protein